MQPLRNKSAFILNDIFNICAVFSYARIATLLNPFAQHWLLRRKKLVCRIEAFFDPATFTQAQKPF